MLRCRRLSKIVRRVNRSIGVEIGGNEEIHENSANRGT